MQKFLGFIIILGAVIGGFVFAGGNVASLWQPAEFLIIFGAGFGALIVGNTRYTLREMLAQVKGVFGAGQDQKELYRELLLLMHELLDIAKLKGARELDEHVETPHSSSVFLSHPMVLENEELVAFVCDNLRLLGMGKVSAHDFDSLLEQEIYTMAQQKLKPSTALANIAEAMPGFGILAAVGGIVITMQHLDGSMTEIGLHIAAALVGTFIGIFGCYCVFHPISSGMETYAKKQVALLECAKAIMVAYANGHVALVATDSGRRLINQELKPSFTEMEQWINDKVA